ncbi:hypothetical protein PFISCL1PPCAC_20991, partial [Pristionchus fissidentatus]
TDDESNADTNVSIYDFAKMETANRPKVPYPTLIALACKLSTSGALRVQEMYEFIRRMYPFYRNSDLSWQNSIRHSLTAAKKFEKSDPEKKGSKWMIIPSKMANMEKQIKK